MGDYDKFEQIFSGSWTWARDDGVAAVLEEIGTSKPMIDFDAASEPKMVMSIEKGPNGNEKLFKSHIEMKAGDMSVPFDMDATFGVTKEVKDKEENPTLTSKMTLTMDGDKFINAVEPISPPGKKYTVSSVVINGELHATYQVVGSSLKGTRVYSRAK